MRLIISLSFILFSSAAIADLPAPPEGAELGACQPHQQRLPTDADCVSCETLGSGEPCEQEWRPKGYEQRCRVQIRGYNNEVWCKGTVSAKKLEAKSCAVDPAEDGSGVGLLGLFALLALRRKRG